MCREVLVANIIGEFRGRIVDGFGYAGRVEAEGGDANCVLEFFDVLECIVGLKGFFLSLRLCSLSFSLLDSL
jgi:hypothetical protein